MEWAGLTLTLMEKKREREREKGGGKVVQKRQREKRNDELNGGSGAAMIIFPFTSLSNFFDLVEWDPGALATIVLVD